MENNKNTQLKLNSNGKIFIYRIVVAIVFLISILLVYGLNNLSNSKESMAMQIDSNSLNATTTEKTEEKIPSEESQRKLQDWKLMLVNYENEMPKDYVPKLSVLEDDKKFDSRAISGLIKMLEDMQSDGITKIWAQSTYRDPTKQDKLIKESIQEYLEQGKTQEEAETLTARSIGEPYKSEHNLGLAVDFNYVDYSFEDEPAFKWLMKHAQDYGFILRYPEDKEEITKIKYEPWHWRYVGTEYAKEIKEMGVCLEEYIEYLKNN